MDNDRQQRHANAQPLDARLLSLLASGPVCVTCAASRLDCDKRDVLAATHVLITNRSVRCEFTACPFCGKLELIIRPRARG
jgi:hypothetical protein